MWNCQHTGRHSFESNLFRPGVGAGTSEAVLPVGGDVDLSRSASAAIDSLDRCMGVLHGKDIKADGAGFGAARCSAVSILSWRPVGGLLPTLQPIARDRLQKGEHCQELLAEPTIARW